MFDVIIIGGGIGGAAAALRSAQNGMATVWFLGSRATRKRSRSQWVDNLDNMVGFHEGIIKDQVLMTLTKNKQADAAELVRQEHYHINNRAIIKNTIERIRTDYRNVKIVEAAVTEISRNSETFTAMAGEAYQSTAIVLSTGVMDEQPHIIKSNKKGVLEKSPKWIYPFANREQILYCIRCEGHLTKNDQVAVIGHSNVAAELAMMLYERYSVPVTLITNGENPAFSKDRQALLDYYEIDIMRDPIVGLMSAGARRLRGFIFEDHNTLEVKFALVSLGLHKVYNELAIQLGARLMDEDQPEEKRHVWINHKGETSVANFFAVGDLVKREDEPVMKQVYTAQEYAVRAVDSIDFRRRKANRNLILTR